MNEIEDFDFDKLVLDYGSPLFVASAKTLRNNLKIFKEEFSRKYPKVEVSYSYKANNLLGLLDILHKEGAWAEVASGFEYDLARRIGVTGGSIVFNGPYKKKEELKRAINDGALINVDNIGELERIREIASQSNKTVEIGIRINTDTGVKQLPDRFGFNIESGEAFEIVQDCVKRDLVRVIGLHIHLTSYIIDSGDLLDFVPAKNTKLIWPKSSIIYKVASERIAVFAEEIRRRFGITIKYIDMGGGFPTVEELRPYVEAITLPILEVFKHDVPVLILEPGRAIVNDTIRLIATVVNVKEIANGKRHVVIDAGINLLPTSLWRFQELESLNTKDMDLKETIVYGPLCLQTDIVGIAILPELDIGDKLFIKNVGAYNISQSSSFIFPKPNIILKDGDEVRVIRRAETIEDILLHEN